MPDRYLLQINILKSGVRKINIAPPLHLVLRTESMAQDRVAHHQPRIARDIRIRNPHQIARQSIDVQAGVKITGRAVRKIEVSSALPIAQGLVVPPLPAAPTNGIRIAHHSTVAPELKARAGIVRLLRVAPTNGIKIAAHKAAAREAKVRDRPVLL